MCQQKGKTEEKPRRKYREAQEDTGAETLKDALIFRRRHRDVTRSAFIILFTSGGTVATRLVESTSKWKLILDSSVVYTFFVFTLSLSRSLSSV